MLDFYSRNDVTYNGDVYSIPFPYMKEEEIQVYLDDVLFTDWFFLNDSQIRLRSLPEGVTSDTVVSVRRATNIDDKVVTYTNNTLLNKENLNLSQDQLLYAVQEIYDNNVQFQIDTDEVIETNRQEVLEIQEVFEQETRQQLLQNKTEIENRVVQFENEVNNTIDEVKEAANKVNELEEAVDTAVTAANTATEQAGIAINKANETTEIVEQFTENIDSKISTNNENMQSVLAETEAVLQEAKDTLDDTLNKSQITNCLLEVPQNIKLELADGKLTLKAGSKYIFPNGAGIFEEITTTTDKTTWPASNGQRYVCITDSGYFVIVEGNGRISSGSTDSLDGTTWHVWYDTTNNKVFRYRENAITPEYQMSLPVALITTTDGEITSIDQVFNGMGYIGSTVWVDKGVKGLVPNGFNNHKGLNNIEAVTKKINVITQTGTYDRRMYLLSNGDINITANSYDYNSDKNFVYINDVKSSALYIGDVNMTNSVITNFQPKLPVRLVDYNDLENYVKGMPVGTVFSHTCSASFVPENSLPCNGSEYTQAQFPNLYNDWLVGGKLKTCTYTEYSNMLTTYGQCPMWALDATNKKFKVPTIKDGAVVQQAMSNAEIGKAYNAGLPNITGSIENGAGSDYRVSTNNGIGALSTLKKDNTLKYGTGGLVNRTTGIKLDASLSNPIYGNSNTVQMNAVALRYFVVVATKAINQSAMDWSNWASNIADKISKSECSAYIIQTYVNGTSWYRIWSDGWIEQGGDAKIGTGDTTITFLKSFSNNSYTYVCTPISGDGSYTTVTIKSLTAQKIVVYLQQSTYSKNSRWYACGY